jgi:hypothetical protein
MADMMTGESIGIRLGLDPLRLEAEEEQACFERDLDRYLREIADRREDLEDRLLVRAGDGNRTT